MLKVAIMQVENASCAEMDSPRLGHNGIAFGSPETFREELTIDHAGRHGNA